MPQKPASLEPVEQVRHRLAIRVSGNNIPEYRKAYRVDRHLFPANSDKRPVAVSEAFVSGFTGMVLADLSHMTRRRRRRVRVTHERCIAESASCQKHGPAHSARLSGNTASTRYHIQHTEQASSESKRSNRYTILVLLFIGCGAMIPIMTVFFIPLVLAATFATIFYGLYNRLYRCLWHQGAVSAFLVCLILVIGMIIPAYALIQIVVNQTMHLYNQTMPAIRTILQEETQAEWLQRIRDVSFGRWLIDTVEWNEVIQSLGNSLTSLGTKILNRTSAGVFGFAVNLLIILFLMFYFFLDGRKIVAFAQHLFPLREEYKKRIISNFLLISRATVWGTLIIGVTQGTLGAVTLLIFGVESWLLWGFIMLLLSIIPLIGPPIILIPAGIIQLLAGNVPQGLGIILSSLLVVSSVDNVLRPRVVGSGARMHDILVFISTLGGLSIFGVMGFIVGPVIASFFVAVIDIYHSEYESRLGTYDHDSKNMEHNHE